jgi:hypothetical protein
MNIGCARVSAFDQNLDLQMHALIKVGCKKIFPARAGARFRSLSEPWANTTTRAGKLIMTVFAGIAEI